MREIKFRAWGPNSKYMWSWEELIANNIPINWLSGDPNFCGERVIMQYTGLKDKNGKEIYEGDKILDSNSVVWIVSFGAGSFVATMMGGSDCESLYSVIDKELEVIGNIYQRKATP